MESEILSLYLGQTNKKMKESSKMIQISADYHYIISNNILRQLCICDNIFFFIKHGYLTYTIFKITDQEFCEKRSIRSMSLTIFKIIWQFLFSFFFFFFWRNQNIKLDVVFSNTRLVTKINSITKQLSCPILSYHMYKYQK